MLERLSTPRKRDFPVKPAVWRERAAARDRDLRKPSSAPSDFRRVVWCAGDTVRRSNRRLHRVGDRGDTGKGHHIGVKR
jgi:hypothetical protein